MNQIILIGFMGAGKTTIGKALAKSLNREFADTDERIEADTGRKIPDIFEKEGEPYFRRLETETLQKLEKEGIPRVIAVGGGLPMQPENGPILNRMGTVVFLEADTDTLEARLRGDTSRPKLQGRRTAGADFDLDAGTGGNLPAGGASERADRPQKRG